MKHQNMTNAGLNDGERIKRATPGLVSIMAEWIGTPARREITLNVLLHNESQRTCLLVISRGNASNRFCPEYLLNLCTLV